MTDPRPELFADVAAQFERLDQPLNLEWLKERNVSLEELQALSQQIALILRGYMALPPKDRIAFVTAGVFTRPTVDKPAETILGARHDAATKPTTIK